jgi:predicted PurR-regulated permease PerM
MGVLTPIFYGVVIAFLVDPIVRFCERVLGRIFRKRNEQRRLKENPAKLEKQKKRFRAVSIIFALLFVLGIITGLLLLVIPQIINSLSMMIDNFQSYFGNFTKWIDGFMASDSTLGKLIKNFLGESYEKVGELLETNVMPQAQKYLTGLASGAIGFVWTIKDLVIGFIIAIYFLFHKEKFIAHIKMLLYSFLKKERVNKIISVGQDANKYFGGFITGKILDSAIVGVLCFIVMTIFRFDYSLLISVIVGVTNIIPFFGPFIGAIPSALFLLIVDPMQCLYFIIWVVILQQIDGNIIGPMVLGSRTGVSGFWVITSIVVFGGFFGIVGIIIAVPMCAVLLVLGKRRIANGLRRRKMAVDTDVYLHPGTIYEDDDVLDDDDGTYQKPVKSADVHRVPEAHEQRQKSKYVVWLKKKVQQAKIKNDQK